MKAQRRVLFVDRRSFGEAETCMVGSYRSGEVCIWEHNFCWWICESDRMLKVIVKERGIEMSERSEIQGPFCLTWSYGPPHCKWKGMS